MIVNWTNEEGSRFAPPCFASGVYAGVFTPDYAYERADRDGADLGDELARIGYRGSEAGGQAQRSRRDVRAPHRARADPRGREEDDRRRHRRAGHALVRGDGDRPRQPCRLDRCAQARRPWAAAHDPGGDRRRRGLAPDAVATVGLARCGRTAAMSSRRIPTRPRWAGGRHRHCRSSSSASRRSAARRTSSCPPPAACHGPCPCSSRCACHPGCSCSARSICSPSHQLSRTQASHWFQVTGVVAMAKDRGDC